MSASRSDLWHYSAGASYQETLEFRGLRTIIQPEGDVAQVLIKTNNGLINMAVPFRYIGQANTEIRHAALIMTYRQAMKDNDTIKELLQTALTPLEISVHVDRHTGDRYWICQFDEHAPIVIRLSPKLNDSALAELSEEVKKASN